jgi:hypothetical protein
VTKQTRDEADEIGSFSSLESAFYSGSGTLIIGRLCYFAATQGRILEDNQTEARRKRTK